MKTCREVALALSSDSSEGASLGLRMALWMHLAMCRHCRAFRQQLEWLTGFARGTTGATESEPSNSFEARIVNRMRVQ